jgi:hypothetical protein
MFFKKKIPEPPSISSEQQYIEWFIEYSDKVAHIRKLYKKNLDKFIVACTKGAINVLSDYPTGDSLFERIGDLSVAYENEMKPLVENRGGLERCPPELQGAIVSVLMNIFVGIEFLEKKYEHKEALELFSAIR